MKEGGVYLKCTCKGYVAMRLLLNRVHYRGKCINRSCRKEWIKTLDEIEEINQMVDEGFEVHEDIEVGDLSDQEGQEVIEAARRVTFTIKKAERDVIVDKETQEVLFKKLKVTLAVGPLGVDGEGKYKNKHFFPSLLLWFNSDRYSSDWWQKKSRYPFKSFLLALGFDPKQPPVINEEFINGLVGQEVIADIQKSEVRRKDGSGKYVGTGEYENVIANFKKVAAPETGV